MASEVHTRRSFDPSVSDLVLPVMDPWYGGQLNAMEKRIRDKYPGDGVKFVDIGRRNFLRLLRVVEPMRYGDVAVTPAFSLERELDEEINAMDSGLLQQDPSLPIKAKSTYFPEEREALKHLISQYRIAKMYNGPAQEKIMSLVREMRLAIHNRLDAEGVYRKIRKISV